MKKVLIVNSSASGSNAESKKLTDVFVAHWKSTHSYSRINFRDLGNVAVPHITAQWIGAAFKPEASRSAAEAEVLKTSDDYIAELLEADVIVIGAPMYNWSIPSSLKAYIDQVLRVNKTFKIDRTNVPHPYVGLLKNKTLVLLLSRGEQGYEKGDDNQYMDFQSPYLKMVFGIMGITRIHVVTLNGKSLGGERFRTSLDASHHTIRTLVDDISEGIINDHDHERIGIKRNDNDEE